MRFKYQQFFGNLVSGVLTASRKWSLPDKEGTIAITSDVVQPNILINGDFSIAQKAISGTITAGTATPTASLGYQVADNWFGYSIGGNPAVAQVDGSGNVLNRYQITGVAGVGSIGIGQRIESINAVQLAGSTATLSVDLSNSVLGTVTWTASYPTTTANTFGTIGTPTKTQIATGTFNVTSTLTRFSASFSCDSNVRKGLEILFTVGAQTSGTWVLGNVKLEAGNLVTPFLVNGNELLLCSRYFTLVPISIQSPNAGGLSFGYSFRTPMRIIPVSTLQTTGESSNVTSLLLTRDITRLGAFSQIITNNSSGYAINYLYNFSSYIP